jgi:hypothetical protein
MQPADFDARCPAGVPDIATLAGRHAPRIVAEREERDLESTVSEAGRQRALPIERQFAYHLVAQGQFHRTLGLLDGAEALRQCR